METTNTTKMIARYTRKGGNPTEGAQLLAELMERHDRCNLNSALAYWGFIPTR